LVTDRFKDSSNQRCQEPDETLNYRKDGTNLEGGGKKDRQFLDGFDEPSRADGRWRPNFFRLPQFLGHRSFRSCLLLLGHISGMDVPAQSSLMPPRPARKAAPVCMDR